MSLNRLGWQEIANQSIFQNQLFAMRKSTQVSSDGQKGDFYLLDAPDWVNTAALEFDSQGEAWLHLVRQHRFGSNSLALEFPGGMVDAGELPLEGAQRELLEETGLRAKTWVHLASINPNAAFMTNTTHAYLALDLEQVAAQELDPNERIDIHKVKVNDLINGLYPEFYINGIMLITWHWLLQWLEKQS